MKKEIVKFVFSLIAITACFVSNAQESYTFRYNKQELKEIQSTYQIPDHFMGKDIAKKMQLLKESYTYMEEGDVNQTTKTVVEKASIYYSVNKMSKFYKKQVKAGAVTLEEATKQFDHILNIALNIRHQETRKLEEELWKIKDPNEIASLYQKRITIDY